MMPCSRPRRPGVTLMEVLVTILVVSLALMSLMTLFPLGAMKALQAIKDDRTAHAAGNATAVLRATWRAALQSGNTDSTWEAGMTNGPIYFDPITLASYPAGTQQTVANITGGIPRVTLSSIDSSSKAKRWFSLLDDMEFQVNGQPMVRNSMLQRDHRYTWAYMIRKLRRPDGSPDPRALEFSVVVYTDRVPGQSASLVPVGETAYTATKFDLTNNIATITYSSPATKPNLRVGSWILDATMAGTDSPDTHGYFNRVTKVEDLNSTTLEVSVARPFRGTFTNVIASGPDTGKYLGTVVVMDNVAEVYLRGTLE